jgi:hypothetical protein
MPVGLVQALALACALGVFVVFSFLIWWRR